jgi:hypothetical protein
VLPAVYELTHSPLGFVSLDPGTDTAHRDLNPSQTVSCEVVNSTGRTYGERGSETPILLIEADIHCRKAFRRTLAGKKYSFTLAATGQKSPRRRRALSNRNPALRLDVMLEAHPELGSCLIGSPRFPDLDLNARRRLSSCRRELEQTKFLEPSSGLLTNL